MSELAVQIEDLSKVYKLYDKPMDRMKEALSLTKKQYSREYYALKNLSLKIYRGETIGIVGTNGSGKSTLLKIITGVLTQTKGNIVVNGKISALLELGAGFNPEYTGMENIYLNGMMMGYTEEEMKEKEKGIIDFADIGDFLYQPVKSYSSGMFARLAFAVAINVEPEILIVDEALAVGDTKFQMKCMKKMKAMMESGVTVLFVSHDTNTIRRFCTRAIWINKGILVRDGTVNTIMDEYLDYLKSGILPNKESKRIQLEKERDFIPTDGMAEIIHFGLYDKNDREVDSVSLDEECYVLVTYDVYDEEVENPVLGIAIRSIDDDYICGLNTLLDDKKITWSYGRNQCRLEYPQGILAMGGKYYFDVALYDETATVPIQYISKIKDFIITMGYKGEGRYIIPHKWR